LKNNTKQFGIITILIILATLSRLIEHPLNFVPISAMILFGAAHFKKKWQVFLVPFFATLISDLFLSNGPFYFNFWIYGSYFLIMLFGIKLYNNKVSASNIISGAIGSSLIFFIVSNFGVWMNPLYMKSLMACYIDALPFYQNTLASNMFYSVILFGSYYGLQTKFQILQLNHIKYYSK
tara:strand:- start:376 stop:912 length:537 start_codon:yes stop_codon:yes gene_type:complete